MNEHVFGIKGKYKYIPTTPLRESFHLFSFALFFPGVQCVHHLWLSAVFVTNSHQARRKFFFTIDIDLNLHVKSTKQTMMCHSFCQSVNQHHLVCIGLYVRLCVSRRIRTTHCVSLSINQCFSPFMVLIHVCDHNLRANACDIPICNVSLSPIHGVSSFLSHIH